MFQAVIRLDEERHSLRVVTWGKWDRNKQNTISVSFKFHRKIVSVLHTSQGWREYLTKLRGKIFPSSFG